MTIGANMTAVGNMGKMDRSVWTEGSICGTGKTASSVMGNALDSVKKYGSDFKLDLTVNGKSFPMQINSKTTPEDLFKLLKEAGLGENTAGMIANAIRSHAYGEVEGTTDTLKVDIEH